MIPSGSARMCGSRSGGHFTSAGTSKRRIGIVLSGYAPAMTLMSGAMLGFMDKGIEFDAISTSAQERWLDC
jgi:hypothetical protein